MMKVKEIMTTGSVKHCGPETKLREAAKTMKVANCGALPVVDKDQKILGIVTDRDIALSLAKEQPKPHSDFMVKEIMSTKVHTILENEEVEVALEKMRINQVGRLPVVNELNQLQGIVSVHNLLSKPPVLNNLNLDSLYSSKGEHILKTIKSLADRYNQPKASKKNLIKSNV